MSDSLMTAEQFENWLDNALPGDKKTYLIGDLRWMRWCAGSNRDAISIAASEIGNAVYYAWQNGLVELAQKRVPIPDGMLIRGKVLYTGFEYVATKRATIVPPPKKAKHKRKPVRREGRIMRVLEAA